ncbi:SDR family oxidoreductase [Rhodobacteraceae bacterium NNCM2]|nr:SDR family oxidoreductase [Coraliihabitans acroporae]
MALALAHAFAERGHPLMLALRSPKRLQPVADDIGVRHKVDVSLHAYEATKMTGQEEFLDSLPHKPRVIVCAVGYMPEQDEAAADPAIARKVIDTNFTGPALFMEIAATRLAAMNDETALIGISSVAGDRGRAKNYIYGAAKAGFTTWLSGMRQKYAASRLHVMTVKPGFVRTAMTEGMDLPGPVTVDPDDVAKQVLASLDKKHHVIYTSVWRWIMTIIGMIPEPIFKKMKF